MPKIVLLWFFCGLALAVFAQSQMQLLTSIDSPFESDTDLWGGKVKGNGDINGDGYNDIVLSGHTIGSEMGRRDVYIYLGGSTLSTDPDYIIPDPAYPGPYHQFGRTIAYNGDLNGDGYCDLVISETGYGVDQWGRVLVYYGGPNFDIIPDMIFDGLEYGIIPWYLEFGDNIDISGDFNGDGYNDLVVSSLHWNMYQYGQVNIFYGGPDFDTVCDWFHHGEMGESYGISLSVGDLNGDGFSDLVTSSLNIDQVDAQCLKVFFGGSVFDNICDATYGEFDTYFILRLIMGDFNNDSFDDLAFFEGNGFYICWGSDTVDLEFELWHTPPTNILSIYCARFNDGNYLCYGVPQLEIFNFFRWDNADGLVLDYIINEVYNPNTSTQLSYFLGDVNGDGHGEILLSNSSGSPVVFKVFTTEYNGNSTDDNVITCPVQLFACPNPFGQSLSLTYELKEPGMIGLSVFNFKGQLVAKIDDGQRGAGQYSVNWNGKDNMGGKLPSGVYLIKLRLGERIITCKKVTLCY
jgi:hypothetical protein